MDTFITLTTLKNEKFLCNVEKIVYIGEVKDGSIVYIDEFTRYTVKESVSEIFIILTEKFLNKAKSGKN